MQVYCGDYPANGYSIPYVMEIGWEHVYIKTGELDVDVKARTNPDGDVLWKINKGSVSFQSPEQLAGLFKEYDAYANAMFRKFVLEG